PPQVDMATLRKVPLWRALEFFRIEALLRSEEVQRMYRKNATGRSLHKRFGIFWDGLRGYHHYLLRSATLEDAGIVDMDKWQNPNKAQLLIYPIRHDPPRFIHLQLDCAVPPATVVKTLMPLLTERHRPLKVALEKSWTVLRHPKENPPITHVAAWLTYLNCYDLRQCDGLTFGQIGKQVFGAPAGRGSQAAKGKRTHYDQAERGYKAVKRLIKEAVANHWPPDLS
ncbi:MAG: hypothetical protein ABIQ24_07260, partial [Nitrospiraceae bacterium]